VPRDDVRLMGVEAPDLVLGVEAVESSSSSGDADFRFRGVTVPDEDAIARCLFSKKERISLSKID
jgi:hypothetical protein